uniref:Uncharacterized protein n=1 Tax=Anopheles dirus TaxID=7168 RepID=A0A182NYC5_9DIPT
MPLPRAPSADRPSHRGTYPHCAHRRHRCGRPRCPHCSVPGTASCTAPCQTHADRSASTNPTFQSQDPLNPSRPRCSLCSLRHRAARARRHPAANILVQQTDLTPRRSPARSGQCRACARHS